MGKIKVSDKTFKPYISNESIEKAIDAVALRLNADYAKRNEPPVLLCVLNGSIMFTAELMKRLNFDLELISIKLSSYCGTECSGQVRQVMGMTGSVKGKDVLVVEDIVDTGGTIEDLKSILAGEGAREVKICTMLFKPEVFKKDFPIDYVAMEIPKAFILGYGLDYNELGRNYKDIYVLDED